MDPAPALERLYHARYASFRRAVAPLVGADAAHDVVQDAFATALARRASFRGGSLEAWVWRILVRRALELRRRPQPLELGDDEVALLESSREPELAAAIAALPPRRRLVVFLRYYADLSYAQIADVAGIGEGTVAATLAQAHAELRRALRPEEVTR